MVGRAVNRFLVAALIGGGCCPAAARGQTLFGTVVDESSTPVSGVLVTLRDSALQVGTRVLTDQTGRFFLRPHAGRYTLSFEHIGFARLVRSAELSASDPLKVDVQLKTAPVVLTSIVAEGKGRCGSTNDAQAAHLWYLAQTALASLSAETPKRFRIRNYSRDLDVLLRPQSADRAEIVTANNTRSFRAEPSTSLLTKGFVQRRDDGLWFFGPDAELLLSDDFVNGHCFRVAREKTRKDLVGLAFSPGASKLKHDIRGTIWLDELSGELKFVEYVYTGIDADLDEKFASGRVEFNRLDDGSWIIRRWYIHMPLYTVQYLPTVFPGRRGTTVSGPPARRVVVERVIEEGGEVLDIQMPRRVETIAPYCTDAQLNEAADLLAYPSDRLGALIGSVREAETPVAGARVHVHWDARPQPDVVINRSVTDAWAETDERGGFTVCGIPIELDLQVEILEGDVVIKRDVILRGRERALRRVYQIAPLQRPRST
jgi:hypothetical protein